MPGVTVAEATRFTGPASSELDMVFQFEHVQLDFGAHRYDPRQLDLRGAQDNHGRLAGRARRPGMELPVLGQPRPAPVAVSFRRRR